MNHKCTPYDTQNIFARIVRKEAYALILLETEYTVAFHDAFPLAPVHVLIIPKREYITAGDFFSRATDAEVLDWRTVIATAIHQLDLQESGYRLVCNAGIDGGQVVPHFHMHLLGKKRLGSFDGV